MSKRRVILAVTILRLRICEFCRRPSAHVMSTRAIDNNMALMSTSDNQIQVQVRICNQWQPSTQALYINCFIAHCASYLFGCCVSFMIHFFILYYLTVVSGENDRRKVMAMAMEKRVSVACLWRYHCNRFNCLERLRNELWMLYSVHTDE